MDGQVAIERNVEALKRILLSLVAMAGFAASFTSPLWGGRREASGGGSFQPNTPTPNPSPQGGGEFRLTLPRHLHRAILRLLRPAEAAARRLIIAMALTPRGNGVAVPPWRGPAPKVERRRKRHFQPTMPSQPKPRPGPRRLALPLTDPLQHPFRRTPVRPSSIPRLWAEGMTAPRLAVPLPPAPDDRLDATRLRLRLDALASALGDLPRQALRFARWRARQAFWRAHDAKRVRWPLRPGRPPGSPPRGGRETHEVQTVLAHAHGLGWWALEQRADTS